MARIFPLDNTDYTAADLGSWCATRTRGVFSAEESFTVAADGSMNLTVSPGLAWMRRDEWWGINFLEVEETILPVTAPTGVSSIVYGVTLRHNKTDNTGLIYLKSPESAGLNPLPTRDNLTEELIVAYVTVNNGQTSITQAAVADKRGDEALCGLMRDGVTGIPTAMLQEQASQLLDLIKTELDNLNAGTESMLKTEYDASGEVLSAGGISAFVAPMSIHAYTHSKTGTVHTLTGTGDNIKFKATADYVDGDTIKIGSTTLTISGEPAFLSGQTVLALLDGSTINFRSGGSQLNYSIKAAATLPTGKENDIVIITTEPITSTHITPIQPTGVTGSAWIKSAASGEITAFNALKKDELQVYPQVAYQYYTGAWHKVDAYIYKGTRWIALADWVYYRGTRLAGSLQVSGGGMSGWTVSYDTDKITLTRPVASAGNVPFFADLKDLTPYKQIKYRATSTNTLTVCVLNTNGTIAKSTTHAASATEYDVVLDVADQTGNKYIGFYTDFASVGSCAMYEVRAEKVDTP